MYWMKYNILSEAEPALYNQIDGAKTAPFMRIQSRILISYVTERKLKWSKNNVCDIIVD